MTTIADTIAALDGQQAIRVLALTLDHTAPLPDPTGLRALDAGLREALTTDTGLTGYEQADGGPTDPGDLARAVLLHLAATQPALAPVIIQATTPDAGATRFEPATLALGALVILALQTEVKLTRNTKGKWALNLHKHPMRDSTLAQVISKLLALYKPGGN